MSVHKHLVEVFKLFCPFEDGLQKEDTLNYFANPVINSHLGIPPI
jgi:hypothetical protein